MKKLLFCFAMFALALAGCNDKVTIDYEYVVNYIYLNDSSSEITVHSFTPSSFMSVDSLFTIPVKGLHTISFSGDGYVRPLRWQVLSNKEDYTTISNGEKSVTQTLADGDDLYMIDKYIVFSEKEWRKTVLFVFTDSFFDNGEPIEE